MDATPPRHSGADDATPPGLAQQHQPEEQRPSSGDSSSNHPTGTVPDPDNDHAPDSATPQNNSPPPFWSSASASRPVSYHSLSDGPPIAPFGGGPIQLEDHSADTHVLAQSCWASSATITGHVVVSGATGIGAYVVWHCSVRTLEGGGDLEIRKRYSEFATLRANLVRSFPHAEAMIPELPRKSLVSRFRPEFLEARQRGLSHFLNCVLLNPEFASSPVLKEFVFS